MCRRLSKRIPIHFGGYPDQELDCRERLEALLTGYVHCARNAYDSIRTIENTGDTDSVKAVNRLIAAAEKGLCFIELYLEGLALHMDGNRLPAWPVSQMYSSNEYLEPPLCRREGIRYEPAD